MQHVEPAALDALRRLLADGSPDWRVIHDNGADEPFDGEKLVASLVQAEVPLGVAARLYGQFVAEASEQYPDGRMRLADVRHLVANLLMRLPSGDRTYWLSNYEHMFALDREFPDEEPAPESDARYLDPASGPALERHLYRLVRARLDVAEAPAGGPGTERRDAIGDAVDRVARIVRLCGFYRVPRDFLELLVDILAEHSSRLVFPGRAIDGEQQLRILATAEDLLGAAELYSRSAEHRAGLGTALILATAPVATNLLQQHGFLPRSGPEQMLRQTLGVLETGARYAGGPARDDDHSANAVGARTARSSRSSRHTACVRANWWMPVGRPSPPPGWMARRQPARPLRWARRRPRVQSRRPGASSTSRALRSPRRRDCARPGRRWRRSRSITITRSPR